ncbi:MAG: heme biosynthesis HemY N-terminal domain-containing protein [Hyphomicrobiaceae bacterium]
MLRLVLYFLLVAGLAFALGWLADNPGSIVINWQGYIWDTDVFQMTIIVSLVGAGLVLLWAALRGIWQGPAAISSFFNRRREKRGLEALSSGMIAIGAGDRALATRYAIQARKSLPNEPMTHLLRAQAAQLAGDRTTSRRIFEAMLGSPDTEALGLRGLFLEAEREGEQEAAHQFAERAIKLNPKLTWPVDALFDIQCRESDWAGALDTLAVAKKHGHIEKPLADRRRAVLLSGQAQELEDSDPEKAMNLALEAHTLASNLVPAAAIAGRILAARGSTPKATRVIQKTWRKSPHPDLAIAYAYARMGNSPRDRLQRVRELAALAPNSIESPIAVANAAIESQQYDVAREALEPLMEGRLTQRICTLMARIEGEQHNNPGAVREWLARAVNAPRDPAWTADGITSDDWQPVSPVSGALDAFQWRVPVETTGPRDKEFLAQKIEELVKLGVRPETMLTTESEMTVAQTAVDVTPAPASLNDEILNRRSPSENSAMTTSSIASTSEPPSSDSVVQSNKAEIPPAVEVEKDSPQSGDRSIGAESLERGSDVTSPSSTVTPSTKTPETRTILSDRQAPDATSQEKGTVREAAASARTGPTAVDKTPSSAEVSSPATSQGSTSSVRQQQAEPKVLVSPRGSDDSTDDKTTDKNASRAREAARI